MTLWKFGFPLVTVQVMAPLGVAISQTNTYVLTPITPPEAWTSLPK
jgi:hypothetical protein